MDRLKRLGRIAWGNFDKFALLAGWLMTITLPPWLLSYSHHVTPIEYFAATGLTFLGVVFIWAASWKATLWRIESKRAARVEGESSLFDPMAPRYIDKRLYLRDLAPLGRKLVTGKKFINCEIIGPGTAVLGGRSSQNLPFPIMKDSLTFDVDCIQIDPEATSHLAVGFPDCDFEGCRFYHMTLLFSDRQNDSLNWITPDSNQPRLIEDHGNAQG